MVLVMKKITSTLFLCKKTNKLENEEGRHELNNLLWYDYFIG